MHKIDFATGSLGKVPLIENFLKDIISRTDINNLLNYSHPQGFFKLRRQIANLYGDNFTEENVLITSSAQQALRVVFRNFENKGMSKILLQEPAFFGVVRILKDIKNLSIESFENEKTLRLRADNKKPDVVYLTSNFQNPTGESISDVAKDYLGKVANERNLIIVEDNPYNFLYYDDEFPNNILDRAPANTIHIGSFSKILAPGLRIGYMIAKKEFINDILPLKYTDDISTSSLSQQICQSALDNMIIFKELRDHFKKKRDLALSTLQKFFNDNEDFEWSSPNGGVFIQCRFANEINVSDLVKIAYSKYNLRLQEDKQTYYDGNTRNTTRINFVSNTDEDLIEGIRRLSMASKEARHCLKN